MADYDFQCLSPRDFEKLGRELLSKKLTVDFEIFKEGKDQGIDLLKRIKGKNAIIVQCKRYAPTAFNRLKTDIRNKELAKIQKLSPQTYILFTSVKLSLANKEDLLAVLSPFCKATSDIYGVDEVNGLLDDFPEIQESNFKLWLTSTVVLQKVLNANIANFSDHGIEYVKKHYSKFVSNASVPKAIKILKEHHYCIIAGKPGIGKTTLAHVLLADFIEQGYEMVSISHDVEEGWRKHLHGRKQIFYYDDFLGQTNLDTKLEKNEDDRLIKFIESINSNKESYFILTTREYILNQASLTYEKIGRKAHKLEKCIIELEDYNAINKAEILYNYIFFSSLDNERKLELLSSDVYLKILKHRNYYPRLVEDITDRSFINDNLGLKYGEAVLKYFDNPSAIWARAFRAITPKAQVLLLVLVTFPDTAYYPELELAFFEAYRNLAKKNNWTQGLNDYVEAHAELDGSPVRVTKVQFSEFMNTKKCPKEGLVVEFENPSIRDFLENYLSENAEIVRDLFKSSFFFEQVYYLLTLQIEATKKEIIGFLEPLRRMMLSHLTNLIDRSASSVVNFGGYKNKDTTYYFKSDGGIPEKVSRIIDFFIKHSEIISNDELMSFTQAILEKVKNSETRLKTLVKLADCIHLLNRQADKKIQLNNTTIPAKIRELASDMDDFHAASEYLFNEDDDDEESHSENEEMETRIYNAACNEVASTLRDDGTTIETLEELKEKISHFSSSIGLRYLEDEIDEKIKYIHMKEAEYEQQYNGTNRNYTSSPQANNIKSEDNEIREMFVALRESLE